jgi:hypothetical protein
MTQHKILHEDATHHSELYPASFCYSSEDIRQAKDSYHRTLVFNIDRYSCLTWICTKRYLDRNIWCSCTQFHSFLLNDKIHSLTTLLPQSKCNIISMVKKGIFSHFNDSDIYHSWQFVSFDTIWLFILRRESYVNQHLPFRR